MSSVEPSNISANAGDEKVLSNPNSPEALARRAKLAEAQSSEDKRYDAPPPESSGFMDYEVVWVDEEKRSKEINMGLFLALATMLFLYKAAPDAK